MNSIDIVKKIQEVLNCDIKIAESIKRRCEDVGISDVQMIEKQLDSAYIVVKNVSGRWERLLFVFRQRLFPV